MNVWDVLLILVLAAVVGFALRRCLLRRKGRKSGCSGCCCGCDRACSAPVTDTKGRD